MPIGGIGGNVWGFTCCDWQHLIFGVHEPIGSRHTGIYDIAKVVETQIATMRDANGIPTS